MTPNGFTASFTRTQYVLRCDHCGDLRAMKIRNAPKVRAWARWHAKRSTCASYRGAV